MPIYEDQVSVAAGATFTVPLSPNDRFGGRGGTFRLRAVATTGASSGLARLTALVGNEQLARNNGVLLKAAGVDNFSPALTARGAPADPILVQFTVPGAAPITVHYLVEIENNP